MKTAIEQAIEYMNEEHDNSHYEMERQSIKNCIIIATSLLETEKQQIIDAYQTGEDHFGGDRAETYYTSTFTTNKETLK